MIEREEVGRLQVVLARCVRLAAQSLPVDAVEDAAQEAWLRFLRVDDRTNLPTENLRTAYLIGIFRKVCADLVRRFRRSSGVVRLESELGGYLLADAAGIDGVDEAMEEDRLVSIVRRAMNGLPSRDIDLWIAARVAGVGWKAAGLQVGMAKSEVARARQKILRFLSNGHAIRRFIRELRLERPPPSRQSPTPSPRVPDCET